MPQASVQPAAHVCLYVQQQVFNLMSMARHLVCFGQCSCRRGRVQPLLQSSTQSCHSSKLALRLQEYLTHAPVPADKQADLTNRKGKK